MGHFSYKNVGPFYEMLCGLLPTDSVNIKDCLYLKI